MNTLSEPDAPPSEARPVSPVAKSGDRAVAQPRLTRMTGGVRFIVAYKFTKAVAEVALGVLVLLLASAGLASNLRNVVALARHHAVAVWSIALTDRLLHAVTERHMVVIAVASLLDGVLSFIEGWVLHRRYRWGRWLIVVATSTLVPFEVLRLIHRASVLRALLLLFNLAIVVYLVRSRVDVPLQHAPARPAGARSP